MGGRDHDAAICAEFAVGVVGHGRADHAQIDDVYALSGQALGQRVKERQRVRAHIVAHHHGFGLHKSGKGAADLLGECFGEFGSVNTSNVVCFENSGHDSAPEWLGYALFSIARLRSIGNSRSVFYAEKGVKNFDSRKIRHIVY